MKWDRNETARFIGTLGVAMVIAGYLRYSIQGEFLPFSKRTAYRRRSFSARLRGRRWLSRDPHIFFEAFRSAGCEYLPCWSSPWIAIIALSRTLWAIATTSAFDLDCRKALYVIRSDSPKLFPACPKT